MRSLVYGHVDMHDCLAVADADTAYAEAREITAIAQARTWGEARKVKSVHATNPVTLIEEDEDPAELAAEDEPFNIVELGMIADGDWPPMVASRALELLPDPVRARFGELVDTVHNGDYLEIPVEYEDAFVAELRAHGFSVTRDDNVINLLDGRGFSPIYNTWEPV
ncbi:hypothetical protein [Saccharomonospora iraqiensis]|uniref:hypothetical protein n=1 Tax=Saccharomonospora iraqiensis TaxID=52698 RepID=UPI000426591C|nr:hypothetical protein [Saccharomonospora iraqiensis]